MADNSSNDLKKTFPNGFFIIVFATILAVMFLQNYMNGKMAKVSYSNQAEHLVNLELIQPEDSQKVALTDNLVTFSGKFKDSLSDASSQRYRYLSLLAEHQDLDEQSAELAKQIATTRVAVIKAADWFLHLSSIPIPPGGYQVVDETYDTPNAENHVVVAKLSNRDLPTFSDLRKRLQSVQTPQEVVAFNAVLNQWIGYFSSPVLGISNEAIKQQIKNIASQLVQIPSVSDAASTYNALLNTMGSVIIALDQPQEGMHLIKLRSVRDYREQLSLAADLDHRITQNTAQLDKARQSVANVIWFFNNQELSCKALERQDPESYRLWFSQAKELWNNFPLNKDAFFRAPDQPVNDVLQKKFKSTESTPGYLNYLFTLFPILLIIGALYFVFSRQLKGLGANAMNFGKSPAKLMLKGSNKITFKDVAGIDEAKEELQEIVDFLKDPAKFAALGARIPKGVLCIGPPGTGKTLIAKAVAGEADRPFFSISGSDFVEMFVGVGASRIRDMFEQARKQAPCIIFMDEIDAVGRHRGAGIGGGHDEREQTLNQLLVEMDGFDANAGIILMAATNRPDVLDKALLRPGRFDRRVVIDLPDIKGRYEILKLHAQKIRLDESADLMIVARATPGASGADLSNILNEAALLAVKRSRSAVTQEELVEACDKVRFGKERRSLEITAAEKHNTAYHEAGHAIVGMALKHCDPIEKVTVIPRGLSLGATYSLPTKNRLGYWREELYDLLAMMMGGRCAEEIFIGDISSGAQSDIERATQVASNMVREWGMSDIVGAVAFEDRPENMSNLSTIRTFSPATAQLIDEEIKRLLREAHDKAKQILLDHREQVETMTAMLIEFETLDAIDAKEIMDKTFSIEKKKERLQEAEVRQRSSTPPIPEGAPS